MMSDVPMAAVGGILFLQCVVAECIFTCYVYWRSPWRQDRGGSVREAPTLVHNFENGMPKPCGCLRNLSRCVPCTQPLRLSVTCTQPSLKSPTVELWGGGCNWFTSWPCRQDVVFGLDRSALLLDLYGVPMGTF